MPINPNIPFQSLAIAVMVISDTRDATTDRSGAYLVEALTKAGHTLAEKAFLPDEQNQIINKLQEWMKDAHIPVVITTGGTGLTLRDVTPEALEAIATKTIPGFGELFRQLSFEKIGTSTIQSRALAVVAQSTYIFALPGSTGACKDAWNGILATQLDSRYQPCNFTELFPRLQ